MPSSTPPVLPSPSVRARRATLPFELAGLGLAGLALAGIALAGMASAAEARSRRASPEQRIERSRSERAALAGAHRRDAHRRDRRPRWQRDFRTIDGSFNHPGDPDAGAVGARLLRWGGSDYADGASEMAGAARPSARTVSNLVHAQDAPRPNALGASDYLWQWGQFLDHDLDLTGGADPAEPAPIAVPIGDPHFDPFATGTAQIDFDRSIYDGATGVASPREQVDEITAWIDASNVYGSDAERARALRADDGSGRLRTSAGNLLPFNDAGLPNAGGSDDASLFLAGDVRANEQVGLAAMHTLFVREHNRIVDELAARHRGWRGDRVYEKARQLVGALMQAITYREFLPALLGPNALAPYTGYDPGLEPGIANVFATAAYRFGHSALSPVLQRLDANGDPIAYGPLALRDAFFAPERIVDEGGIEPILRGLAAQRCQRVDAYVVDDVRNFLFGPPGAGGFDLASLNVQRGRDHGLPSYNAARAAFGLAPAADFDDVTSDPALAARLAAAYASVDDVDLWTGGLAEDAVDGAHLGPLFHRIVVMQFQVLRDGDRFWYERVLEPDEVAWANASRLSDVIRRNTAIGDELPDNVFQPEVGASARPR
ncbi:MAG: peroxidase family protein [Myxococcota bacterium]